MIIGDDMKRGFTLVELIATISIIALLSIVIIPSVLNQLGNKKEEISESNKQLIYTATDNYLSYNTEKYPMIPKDVYCITLETLVNNGELKSPIKDFKTGNEIPLNKVVKIIVNDYRDPNYTLVEAQECSELKN